MQNIDPDELFKEYLLRVGTPHLPKNSVQYIELKRAFVGGIGSILVVIIEAFSDDIPEDDAVAILEGLFQYTKAFFENEAKIEENKRMAIIAKKISKFKN